MKDLKSTSSVMFIIVSSVLFLVLITSTEAFSANTCVDCHKDEKFRIQNKKLFDYYKNWKGSVHDEAGITCQDCHGGDATKSEKDESHAINLSPDNVFSRVFFKNIPKTCGECHEKEYKSFVKSKHYKTLKKTIQGPNCVTCHGSVATDVYYSTILSNCVSCHNQQTKNHPEIFGRATHILERLNLTHAYYRWASRHYDKINRLSEISEVRALHEDITDSWHQFDFTNTNRNLFELLSELKSLFNEAYKKEKK